MYISNAFQYRYPEFEEAYRIYILYFNYFLNCPVLTVTIKQIIIIALLLHKIILILNKTRNGNRPNDLDRPLYRSIQLYKSISFRFYF